MDTANTAIVNAIMSIGIVKFMLAVLAKPVLAALTDADLPLPFDDEVGKLFGCVATGDDGEETFGVLPPFGLPAFPCCVGNGVGR